MDINDPKQRAKALEQSNPALDDFVDREQLERAFQQIPENEFRRYFLNQWTSTAERWLPAGVWEQCYEEKKIEKDQRSYLHSMDHIPEMPQLWSESQMKKDHTSKSWDIGKDQSLKIIFGKFQEKK